MNKYISKIDSDRFGFLVAKLNDVQGNIQDTLVQLRNDNVKLAIFRIPIDKSNRINELESLGFRLKDIQQTYNLKLAVEYKPLVSTNEKLIIRSADHQDIPSLMDISKTAFNNYGHYFANKKLDREMCLKIYEDWTNKSIKDIKVATKVLVAEFENKAVGFLSLVKKTDCSANYIAGGLGAVSNKTQGQGVFTSINIAAINWAREQGYERIEHNVLINNFPVNKTYSRLGFNTIKAHATFHLWL